MPTKANPNSDSPLNPKLTQLLIQQFLSAVRMRNCSERTIRHWKFVLHRFVDWCHQRAIESPSDVTPQLLAAYRRSLFYYRNPKTGLPLKFNTQAHYLMPVRRWFEWIKAQGWIATDPTRELELPKSEYRLPTSVLTVEQVEYLLNQTDVQTPMGIRDRSMLETFYSSGIRCGELVNLDLYDVHPEREVLIVRHGKGNKDRVVPISKRALEWITKWIFDIRPQFVSDTTHQSLFISCRGSRLGHNYVSNRVRQYMTDAGIEFRGACHLLRHTAATLMMENGADLRSLQEYLGHARLNTTQIYTHVSIQRLQDVHRKCHPGQANVEPSEKEQAEKQELKKDQRKPDQAKNDRSKKSQSKKGQAVKDQSMKEQSMKDQSMKEQSMKEQSMKDLSMHDQAEKDQAEKDQSVSHQSAMVKAVKAQASIDPSQE